ncbi:MupG family TIM beta-alpha barrel fold protein [Spiroplasma endosymbiont of Anurida maritima]|uniref:MupG family TIM beta-alpha barrel fold protein n=1 Tax=Spiroplasma endosymbiont of Anurida maritima TaxID=2967972 RepID=UPI0036D418F5
MYKKNIGISIYPEFSTLEKHIEYLKKASDYGYNQLFMSFLHLSKEEVKNNLSNFKKIIKQAKKLKFYVCVDISTQTLDVLKENIYELKIFKNMDVDCLRIDTPLLPVQLSIITHKVGIDIQINASIDDSFAQNLLDFKPIKHKISACHNFYPQQLTGLSEEFFNRTSKKYYDMGIKVSAFVGSHHGIYGPQKTQVLELPTMEKHRNMSISAQAKELWASGYITDILIGNEFATDEELKELAEVTRDTIEFEVPKIDISNIEHKILFKDLHFRRGDASEYMIRSPLTRALNKGQIIEPRNNDKESLNFGDVVIVNKNDEHYQTELMIIIKDNTPNINKKFNYLFTINKEELSLINKIEDSTWFKFSPKNN